MGRAGEITEVVVHWRKVPTKNEFGEYIENWTNVGTIRCRFYNKRGREVIDNDEVFDYQIAKFKMRDQHSLAEEERLEYKGTMFIINNIDPDYDRNWIFVSCQKLNE